MPRLRTPQARAASRRRASAAASRPSAATSPSAPPPAPAGATACRIGSSTGNIAMSPRAAWRMACDGRVVGVGEDAAARRRRPARAAASSAAPCPAAARRARRPAPGRRPRRRAAKRSPPGVTKPAMFSMTPPISRSTLCAISAARRATFWATGCGVVTMRNLRLRQQLGERHRDVAGARRQVDEQEVQLAPLDVLEELGEGLVEHRPAPDDGAVLLDEEADRHDLHAVALQRHDLALGRDRRAAARRRTCAGSSSPRRRRRGRRRSCRRRSSAAARLAVIGRLADAALARADADDVGDLGQRALGQPAGAAELLLQAGLLLVGEDVEGDVDALHAVRGRRPPARRRSRSGCGSGSRAWSARR